MMPALLVTSVLVLAAAAPPELALPVTHRTTSITVRTDLGEVWARDAAARIERARDTLVAELSPLLGKRSSARPLTLLAFRSSADYRSYTTTASPTHVRSLGWYDPDRALAVVHTDTRFAPVHEAAHWVLREILDLPTRDDLPVWVVEGLPCIVEAGGKNGLSRFRLYRLSRLRDGTFDPIEGLTATQSDLGRGRDDVLYAAGWATALFLRERHPAAFRAYLAGLSDEKPLPDLAALAKTTPETLAEDLRTYVAALPVVPRDEASRLFPALIPDANRPASEAEVFRQVEFLRHPDLAVQRVAMAWLSNHRHATIVPTLLTILPGESDRFRMDACSQIARLAPKEARAPLVDLLESEDPAIRLRAIRALKKLTRLPGFGYHPHDDPEVRAAAVTRWRAWVRRN